MYLLSTCTVLHASHLECAAGAPGGNGDSKVHEHLKHNRLVATSQAADGTAKLTLERIWVPKKCNAETSLLTECILILFACARTRIHTHTHTHAPHAQDFMYLKAADNDRVIAFQMLAPLFDGPLSVSKAFRATIILIPRLLGLRAVVRT